MCTHLQALPVRTAKVRTCRCVHTYKFAGQDSKNCLRILLIFCPSQICTSLLELLIHCTERCKRPNSSVLHRSIFYSYCMLIIFVWPYIMPKDKIWHLVKFWIDWKSEQEIKQCSHGKCKFESQGQREWVPLNISILRQYYAEIYTGCTSDIFFHNLF